MSAGTRTETPAGVPEAPNTDFSAFATPDVFPWQQTRRVVEAVARLQIEQTRVVRAVELNQPVAAHVIGRGLTGINEALARAAGSGTAPAWTSTRAWCSPGRTRASTTSRTRRCR